MSPAVKYLLWMGRSAFMFSAAALFISAPFLDAADNAGGRAAKVLVAAIGFVIFNVECWTWYRRFQTAKQTQPPQ